MKTKKVTISIAMLTAIALNFAKAQIGQGNQGLWQAGTSQNGNKAVFTKRDVGIGLSNPNSPLHVKGQILGDSLHIFGVARFGNTISINSPNPDDIGSNTGKINLVGDVPLSVSNIKVGIGTQTPVFTLHLEGDGANTNGDILSLGTLATPVNPAPALLLPAGLTGPRFIWFPGKAALRAGEADAPNWDSDSIGFHSVAFGLNTKATGLSSFAMGDSTVASGEHSVAFGHFSRATGHAAVAIGAFAEATSNNAIAIGFGAKAEGIGPLGAPIALGTDAIATAQMATALTLGKAIGRGSLAHGSGSEARAEGSFVTGQGNIADTTTSSIDGARDAFVFGRRNVARGHFAFAGGGHLLFDTIFPPLNPNNQANDTNSFVFGRFSIFRWGTLLCFRQMGAFNRGGLICNGGFCNRRSG